MIRIYLFFLFIHMLLKNCPFIQMYSKYSFTIVNTLKEKSEIDEFARFFEWLVDPFTVFTRLYTM